MYPRLTDAGLELLLSFRNRLVPSFPPCYDRDTYFARLVAHIACSSSELGNHTEGMGPLLLLLVRL
jgi:hypothetical protein